MTTSSFSDLFREWWPVAAVTSVAMVIGVALVRESQKQAPVLAKLKTRQSDPGLAALDHVLHEGVRDDELDYMRSGMRPLLYFRKAFSDAKILGISPTELATSGRYFGQEALPIRINIMPDGKIHLSDGRHRYTAAKEAGAKAILARVMLYDADGDIRLERTTKVRLV